MPKLYCEYARGFVTEEYCRECSKFESCKLLKAFKKEQKKETE